ncbi:glycosyltransferase family 9 protein [Neobacillus sp. Marseille-QA0830]
MKILICQLRNHGDIIRTFPLIEALKAAHPGCFIGFTCLPEMEATCQLCPDIDEVIVQPRLMPIDDHVDNTRICNCEPLAETVYQVRNKHYDVYLDLHGVFQSSVFGSLCEIPVRVGRSKPTAKDGAHLFYNTIADIHEREINRMERHFVIAETYFGRLDPVLGKPFKDYRKNQVAVIPGSSEKGILKRWDSGHYLELIKRIAVSDQVRVLLGPEETDLLATFSPLESDTIKIEVVTGWEQYLDIFKHCRYVVGNDSAALHIAAWKQVPAFTICGPTSAAVNSVWKYGAGKGITSGVPCGCDDVWSGLCENGHQCLNGLTAETVMKEITDVLNEMEG